MKLLNKTAVSAAAIALAASSAFADTAEETRDVKAFTRVALQGSMDVEVKVGPKQSVRVVADDDVIEDLRTRVKGDTLKIYLEDRHYRRIEKLEVYITVPTLEGVGVHGSGDMYVEDAKADEFDVDVHGSGDAVVMNTETGQLNIDLHGSGDIKIDGTCSDVDVEVHGSGDVKASKMKCANADVSINGSGDVDVFADKSAKLSVHGSGDIKISGAPDKINTSVRGSGDIHVR
jgi:hypothetical protein